MTDLWRCCGFKNDFDHIKNKSISKKVGNSEKQYHTNDEKKDLCNTLKVN